MPDCPGDTRTRILENPISVLKTRGMPAVVIVALVLPFYFYLCFTYCSASILRPWLPTIIRVRNQLVRLSDGCRAHEDAKLKKGTDNT